MDYEAVIGLETHVQLKTRSKMWCGCANAFGAPPNTNVCPVPTRCDWFCEHSRASGQWQNAPLPHSGEGKIVPGGGAPC